MASYLSVVFGLFSAILGFVAAFYWFKSSAVKVSQTWEKRDYPGGLDEPVDQIKSMNGWVIGTINTLREGGRLTGC